MDERAYQNLVDAGCSQDFVERYEAAGSDAARMSMLRRHRRDLLDGMHVQQKKLDCLDYLIYQLKRKAS